MFFHADELDTTCECDRYDMCRKFFFWVGHKIP